MRGKERFGDWWVHFMLVENSRHEHTISTTQKYHNRIPFQERHQSNDSFKTKSAHKYYNTGLFVFFGKLVAKQQSLVNVVFGDLVTSIARWMIFVLPNKHNSIRDHSVNHHKEIIELRMWLLPLIPVSLRIQVCPNLANLDQFLIQLASLSLVGF